MIGASSGDAGTFSTSGWNCEMATEARRCEAHGEATRLSCVDCDQPLCPKCMTRTEVGLKCASCAAPVVTPSAAPVRSRRPLVLTVVGLVLLALVGLLLTLRSDPSDKAEPVAAPVGAWEAAPALATIRGTASAVALRDGSVLVAGGGVGALASNGAEVFDPKAQTWSKVGALTTARRGHAAVLLQDGRVLVAGGLSEGSPLASTEVYDPGRRAWIPVRPMSVPRLGHSLTLLDDGRVLVAGGSALDAAESAGGGQTIRAVATAELFDPATGAWTPTGSMGAARFEHTATRLRDGRVVMVGGLGPAAGAGTTRPLASTEIYDPAAGAFVGSTNLAEARANHAAVLLEDNSVLVTGGAGGDGADLSLATAEVFNAPGGTWTTVAAMGATRTGHTATRLPDGRVLVAGGESVQRGTRRSLTSAEVFDFAADAIGRWGPAGDMGCPRSEQAAVLLEDGSALVVAGDAAFPGGAPIAQSCAERYVP